MELSITLYIPDEIISRLDEAGISKENQESALEDGIFLYIHERFFQEQEDEIIQHVISWGEELDD
jgi:hypothetical protein